MSIRAEPRNTEEHIAYIYELLRRRPVDILTLGGAIPTGIHTHDGLGEESTVIGGLAEEDPGKAIADGIRSFAAGDYSQALNLASLAMGYGALSTTEAAIAIGADNAGGSLSNPGQTTAEGAGSVVIGTAATDAGSTAMVVIGYGANNGDTGGSSDGVVIGRVAQAGDQLQPTVVGFQAFIGSGFTSAGAVAVGVDAHVGDTANSDGGIAVGDNAEVDGTGAIGIGAGGIANGIGATYLGDGAIADDENAIAVGRFSFADAIGAIAVGETSSAAFTRSVALGPDATTTKANQIMLGTVTELVTHPGGVEYRVNPQSGDYTVTRFDFYIPVTTGAVTRTMSLPAATGTGQLLLVKKIDSGAGDVIVDAAGADLIDGAGSVTLDDQYDLVFLKDAAAARWDVIHVGAASGGGGGGGGPHTILHADHTDSFAADVPVDADVLTWVSSASRWEARPPAAIQGGGPWELIETQILGSDVASVTFDAVPTGYDDLIVIAYARTDRAAQVGDGFLLRMGNGTVDSGSNYDSAGARQGDTAATFERNRQTSIQGNGGAIFTGDGATAGHFGFLHLVIYDYTDLSFHRMVSWGGARGGSSTNVARELGHGLWLDTTNVIDIIQFLPHNGTVFRSGSEFRLYGQKRVVDTVFGDPDASIFGDVTHQGYSTSPARADHRHSRNADWIWHWSQVAV